ncbi:MAG: hypothetical protein ACYDG5_00580 [Dehalococcoidales bacterium]
MMKGTSGLEAKQSVIICAPDESCILKALRRLKGKTFRWVYLGEDVSQFIAAERRMRKAGERIEIGGKLQEAADSLRQAYIDYIGKLSVANNSLSWWLGSLSEKNPLVSNTFLYACYVRRCQTILKTDSQENLVFIGENKTIRQAILANTPGYAIQRIEAPVREFLSAIKNTSKLAAIKVYLLAQTVYHLCLARRYREKEIKELSLSKGAVLLYNWVDPRSFTPNGNYRDNYFGGLAHHLKTKGKKVCIVPRILSTVPYRQTLKKLEKRLDCFILPEAFLTIPDVCRIFIKTALNLPRKRSFPAFESMDISALVRHDLVRDWWANALTANLLLYKAIERWKDAGISIATTIYPYENQVWEKAYLLAFRKFYPSAKLVGYQHSTVPKMLLNHFFSNAEKPILPFPDKVVTAGKHTEKLLKESGYDPAKVIRGGAIRYIDLLKKKTPTAKRDTLNPVILVTPSIDRNETLELTWKVLKAFGDTPQYKIVFKFHPDCPYSYIADKLEKMPEHFIISEKTVSDLLPESSVLLYTSSSAALEALALGIPIVHIESDFTIDRDNLGDFPSNVRESASTSDDIVKAVQKLLKMSEMELSRQRKLWSEVVAEMFGPVDESTFDLFL